MKVSEIKLQEVKDYCKVEYVDDDSLLQNILTAAKAYIKSYTGLTNESMDTKEELSMALLALVSDLYDNRQFTVHDGKVNFLIKSMLDMHSVNLL